MGSCCAPSPPNQGDPNALKYNNKAIDNYQRDQEKVSKTAKKLLLLGTGSSGKSTLFKSLKIITKDQNMVTEQTESRHVIRQNCVAGILTLLKKSQELYDADPQTNALCLVNMEDRIVEAIQLVVNYGSESFSDVLDFEEVQQLGPCPHSLCPYIYMLC